MALSRSVMYFFSVVLLTLGFGVVAETANQDRSEPGIPELPPEELRPASMEQPVTDELSKTVVNYDASKETYGFFADNGFNRGSSRFLNILELSGYFRTRFNYFRNGHLKTYIPRLKRGTSMMLPGLNMIAESGNVAPTDDKDESSVNPDQNNFSGNMRLRVDPTIHVSEVVRIRSTIDVFDNMVLGSTPNYMSYHGAPSPSWPSSLMTMSQVSPISNINSWQNAISLKRAWAEASFPIGEIRFGRMPFHWGLGILYNSGDDINGDHGDNIDGVFFTTRFFDHYFTPGYHIAYTGRAVRGGGFFSSDNSLSHYLPTEAGQRYPLESGDMTHVLSLSFLKRDSDFIASKKKAEGRVSFNYGLFASYRRQFLDTQSYAADSTDLDAASKLLVKRESHVGAGSIWSSLSYGNFHVEIEAAGIWGKYQIGEKETDRMALNDSVPHEKKRPIWLLQGGIALQSRYGFLNDRLQVGLDSGWASSQQGPGFGLREGSNRQPKPGDADGRKLPPENGYKTNFRFNPAYTVDLLLHKEVLGGISGTFYLKPHLGYFFSRNFGVRGDVIASLAPNKSNTTGNSNWLGVEIDASAFLRSDNGFYFQLAYGVLFPLKGLNHRAGTAEPQELKVFGDAKIAQTLQAYLGVVF